MDGERVGFLIDHRDRADVVARIREGDPQLRDAVRTLIELADSTIEEKPVRPIPEGKTRFAPSGDPQDYVSLSPYWWPNPDDPDGPYFRRDGEVNPERYEYDTPKLSDVGYAIRVLGFAYFITGDERYAEHGAAHARAWFVDPDTRMNPHLRYAQFVPGVADGRPVGIIDTNRLRWTPDAILLFRGSPHWSEEDHKATQQWFSEFVDWLLTSDLGQKERAARNNHGTWYAAQVALYSLFAGRDDVAKEMCESLKERIAWQIEPDGTQPHELTRTQALHYCDFNLRGMMDLASYGKHVGVDLITYETEDGRSIRQALDWVSPYLTGEIEWPYQQIKPRKYGMYYQTLRRAARMYDEPEFERMLDELPAPPDDLCWIDLVLPAHHHDVRGER
ncbi:MAG: alginate lyase family protein [Planctomycetota bacterium]